MGSVKSKAEDPRRDKQNAAADGTAVHHEPHNDTKQTKAAPTSQCNEPEHEPNACTQKGPLGVHWHMRRKKHTHGRKHGERLEHSFECPSGEYAPDFEVGQRVQLLCRPGPAREGMVISKGVTDDECMLYGVRLDKAVIEIRHAFPWQLKALEKPPSACQQMASPLP